MTKTTFPKVFFYTSGLPGAGKTTLAENLEKISNIKQVSLDKIALELFRVPSFAKPEERDLVLKEADYRVEDILWQNDPVIYDANVNTLQWREHLNQLAKKLDARLVMLYVKTPANICRDRALAARRDNNTQILRNVSPEQFDQKLNEFIEPSDHENLIEISGTESFEKQLSKLKKKLAEFI